MPARRSKSRSSPASSNTSRGMVRLKRLGVGSVAKITTLFGVFYGLIVGILLSIAISSGQSSSLGLPPLIQSWGYLSIIVLPIFYGIANLIAGTIMALVYNLFAEWIGGIELQLG